jgi:hypothetical protein
MLDFKLTHYQALLDEDFPAASLDAALLLLSHANFHIAFGPNNINQNFAVLAS